MDSNKEYFAFISYQRRDEEWAERLRNKLEHYRLPSSVRKQDASLPKEIRPIFRDALELAGGVLAKEIETALQNSKYLIVICSPNSAKSPWVDKEIQTFINLGCEDCIIPFIIDGTPYSGNEDTECFPPALRSLKGGKEVLGININELGRDAAAIKVVARMFGLKFDTLWQRYEREKKRKRRIVISSLVFLAIIASIVAGFFMNMSRTISQQNYSLLKAAERMLADSILQTRHIKRITEDSIALAQQNASIQRQYTLIEQQKDEIATERDNVIRANWKMMENQARAVTEQASRLIDEGDPYTAQLLAINLLPTQKKVNKKPLLFETEFVLRKAIESPNIAIKDKSPNLASAFFSSDGRRFISVSDNIRIWDAFTGSFIKSIGSNTLLHTTESYRCAAISPNGKLVVIAQKYDNTICLWDLQKRECIKKFKGHTSLFGTITSLSFSPNGKQFVSSAHDGTIRLWNISSDDHVIYEEEGMGKWVESANFSRDGEKIVAAVNGAIYIWDVEKGDCICVIKNNKGMYKFASFSPSGDSIVTTSTDNTVRIWNVKTENEVKVFRKHTNIVNSAFFSPDGKQILTASSDKTIRIWDIEKNIEVMQIDGFDEVFSACFSPDGKRIISASADNIIRIFKNTATDSSSKTLSGHTGYVTSVSYSPNGKYIVSSSWDKTVRLWNAKTGTEVDKFIGHGILKSAFFSPDGRRIISSDRDSIRIWDADTRDIITTLNEPSLEYASFSPNGRHIISTADEIIRIWDANTYKCVKTLINNYHSVDIEGKIEKTIVGNNVIGCACYNRNENLLISICRKIIYLWDDSKGELIKKFIGHEGSITWVSFSPDGKYIVSASNDKTIKIWEVTTGKCIQTLKGHTHTVNTALFSPDGQWIVSASCDKTIKIWSINSEECLTTLRGHTDFVSYASFSPDGRNIVSASHDKTIKIWDFPPLQQLINETRERFKNRPLTPEERRKYYLE